MSSITKLQINLLKSSAFLLQYNNSKRLFATASSNAELFCKLVIVGAGAGGTTMASRLCSEVGKQNMIVIEPSDVHYYQPFWTLVGAGIKEFKDSHHSTASVLPKGVKWLKDKVTCFNPSENTVTTENGVKVKYEFMIVAMGLTLAFDKIKGLPEAFETPGVCSNYSPHTVKKTFSAISNFQNGNAIFTQPTNPIKCAGAPQKIMYLTDEIFRKNGKRKTSHIHFFTALPTMFSVPKYSEALRNVAGNKSINVNFNHDLIEVKSHTKEAIFRNLNDESILSLKYEMLHVTPPMIAPEVIKNSDLSDPSGFLSVDKNTLQHNKYKNVFGLGDCTSVPTSKTAAAVASQCGVLTNNIIAAMNGKPPLTQYCGYTSCPLVTGNNKGILAEFDFEFKPMETFPFDQGKERFVSYVIKKDILPFLYWNMMLKGYWKGPEILRKFLRLGF